MIKSKLVKVIIIGSMAVCMLTACGNKGETPVTSQESATDSTESSMPEESSSDVGVDMNIKEFAEQIAGQRTDISFVEMTEGYISGVMDFDVSKTTEYAVYIDATGTTVDEFGVFKAAEGSEKEVEDMLKAYLAMRLDTWMDEYMPEEKPKVENAEIKSMGSYYIYTILGDGEKEKVLSGFDSALMD